MEVNLNFSEVFRGLRLEEIKFFISLRLEEIKLFLEHHQKLDIHARAHLLIFNFKF